MRSNKRFVDCVSLRFLAPVGLLLATAGVAEAARTGSVSDFEATFVGETPGDMVERAAFVGDIDASGALDFVVGSPFNAANGTDSGRAYLFLNTSVPSAAGASLAQASVILDGTAGSRLGERFHGGKDLNGDGRADLLIAAPGWNGNMGRVYLFFGRTDWSNVTLASADLVISGSQADQFLGAGGVLLPGDINGDGFADLILASPGYDLDANAKDRGAVYVFLGNSFGWGTRTLITADIIYRGDGNSDFLGSCLAGLGDVNNDGLMDWVVTAPNRDEGGADAGMAYLMLGGDYSAGAFTISLEADIRLRGDGAGDKFGSSVAVGGDLNGDGLKDLLIGAPKSDYNGADSGQVYMIAGRRAGWPIGAVYVKDVATFAFFGAKPGEEIGHEGSIALAEVSGDALAEAFIFADSNDAAGTDAGIAYVFLGRTSGWGTSMNVSVAEVILQGGAAGDYLGIVDPAGAGDLNGDNYGEVLIGAPGSDMGGDDAGEIYVASGVSRWFDLDADGYTPQEGDCDDRDAQANPGIETDDRDGVDNDCDGEVDEDASGGCGKRMVIPEDGPLGAGTLLGFGFALGLFQLRRRMRK